MAGLLGSGLRKKEQSNLLRAQAGQRADMIAAEVARDEAMRNAANKEAGGTVAGAVAPMAYQYARDNNLMGLGKGSEMLSSADYATMKSAVDAMPQNELGNQTRDLFKTNYSEMNNADKFGQWVDKTLNDTTQTLTGTQAPAAVSPNSPLAADPLKADGLLEAQTGPGAETTALAAPEPGLDGVMHQHQAGAEWSKGAMESGVVERAPVDPSTIVQPTTPEAVVGATQGPPDLTGVAPTDSLAPVTENLASGAVEEVGKEATSGIVKEGLGTVAKETGKTVGTEIGKSTVVEAGKNVVAQETGKAVAGETTKVISSNVATEATKAITGEATKNITSSAAQNLASTAAANGVKGVATSATASVASGAASMGAGIAGGLAGGAIGEAVGGKTGGKVGSALGSALAAGMMLGPWGAVAALAISGIMELF